MCAAGISNPKYLLKDVMGGWIDRISRLITDASLGELTKAVEDILSQAGMSSVAELDDYDEGVSLGFGACDGLAFIEFMDDDRDAERLFSANAKKLSIRLAAKVVAVFEGRQGWSFYEFNNGTLSIAWDEAGTVSERCCESAWLDRFVKQQENETHGLIAMPDFMERLLSARLNLPKTFRVPGEPETALRWSTEWKFYY